MNGRGRDVSTGTTAPATTAPLTTTTATSTTAATTSRHRRRLDSTSGDHSDSDTSVVGGREGSNTSLGGGGGSDSVSSALYQWFVDLFFTKGKTHDAASGSDTSSDKSSDFKIDVPSVLQGLELAQLQELELGQAQGQGFERGLAPGLGLYDVFVGTEDPKVIKDKMITHIEPNLTLLYPTLIQGYQRYDDGQ